MKRSVRRNKKGLSVVISTIIITAIAITMAIAVSFWAMGISSSFAKFEKLEIISGYVSDTTVTYTRTFPFPAMNLTCYQVSMQIKNTGTNTATITTVFLDGKPFNTAYPPTRVPGGQLAYQTGLVGTSIQTGQVISGSLYLPLGGFWNSGNYVNLEIETSAGRHYMYTVVLL